DLRAVEPIVIPTPVPVVPESERRIHGPLPPVRLGWTGTRSGFAYLRKLEPVFESLNRRFGADVVLSIVCSEPFSTDSITTEFTHWTEQNEVAALRSFDIGIVPLADDVFAQRKSSLKASLCLSYGVPVVISDVGANTEAVDSGASG